MVVYFVGKEKVIFKTSYYIPVVMSITKLILWSEFKVATLKSISALNY